MAIYIESQNPRELLRDIRTAIEERRILTWSYDKDGDFTITREKWIFRAWLRPYIKNNQLIFGIVSSNKFALTRELYGVYNGRFITTLLAHFCDEIEKISVSSTLKSDIDVWQV